MPNVKCVISFGKKNDNFYGSNVHLSSLPSDDLPSAPLSLCIIEHLNSIYGARPLRVLNRPNYTDFRRHASHLTAWKARWEIKDCRQLHGMTGT
ncbi:hypothetical protein CEXT_203451 [Caerostris extrusa]|uniref:Uncharacterized protein n=1 Tax=Caerostris extrusa TaxID=172846 RepID=A0AAV4TC21_CAEEX|nr:hypothetical protein CEXT_203451 [Caerostris extrusa]